MPVYDLGKVTEPVPVVADCFVISDPKYRKVATVKGVKDGGFCKVSYDASSTGLVSTGAAVFSTAGVWNEGSINTLSNEFAVVKRINGDGNYDLDLYITTGTHGRLYHLRKGVCYNRSSDGSVVDLSDNFEFTADVMTDSKNDIDLKDLDYGTVYFSPTAMKVDIDWGYSVNISLGECITLWANPSIETDVKYQWYKNGTLLVGQTQRFLTILYAKNSDKGVYTVSVMKDDNVSITSTEVHIVQAKTNLALGMSYNYLNLPNKNYPDTDNKELTDGNVPTTASYYKQGFVGFSGSDSKGEIVLDLEQEEAISRISLVTMNTGDAGVGFPSTVQYFVSNDKANWSEVGDVWVCPDDTVDKSELKGLVVASRDCDVKGRYVKVVSTRKTYEFWAEILVYGK